MAGQMVRLIVRRPLAAPRLNTLHTVLHDYLPQFRYQPLAESVLRRRTL